MLVARFLDRFGKGVRTTARDALIADKVGGGEWRVINSDVVEFALGEGIEIPAAAPVPVTRTEDEVAVGGSKGPVVAGEANG